MSTVPARRTLSKGVNMSGSIISLSGAMVDGVPSACDSYALFLEVSTFSISYELYI